MRELHMRIAGSGPELHGPSGLLDHPLTEMLVGYEKDFAVPRRGLDNFYCISRCADYIAERFDRGGAVDVSDDVETRVGAQVRIQFFRGTRFFQRATCISVG